MIDDDVSIDELRQAVEHLHGVPAKFIEAVEVDERFNCEVVWQCAVKVFDITGGARRIKTDQYRSVLLPGVIGSPPRAHSPGAPAYGRP